MCFHYYITKSDSEIFSTSLYEIDRILEDRIAIKHPKDEEDLSKALAAYPNYLDVFLKAALDTLPLH